MPGPSSNFVHIDDLIPANHDGLPKRGSIVPMIKSGQPIFDAVGRREKPEAPSFSTDLENFPNRFVTDGDGRRKELNDERRPDMTKIPSFASEVQGAHRCFGKRDLTYNLENEIQIIGQISILGIDGNAGASGKHRLNAMPPKRLMNQTRQFEKTRSRGDHFF